MTDLGLSQPFTKSDICGSTDCVLFFSIIGRFYCFCLPSQKRYRGLLSKRRLGKALTTNKKAHGYYRERSAFSSSKLKFADFRLLEKQKRL